MNARPLEARTPPPTTLEDARFAHESEEEFARLLDFYGVRWEYEPRMFPLRQADDGRVIEAFSPDFYLPDFDLYIELTTMSQKLVTKKNRKARRVQEQHPDVRVKVLYQRDYLHLLVKYGLEPPSQLAGVDAEGEEFPLLRFGPSRRPESPAEDATAETA